MATIKEVSRRAKVSSATVSRVLTGNAVVTSATRLRVLTAVQDLGYRPNMFARGLVTNRSHSIGVVVNDLSSPYFGALLGGVEEAAEGAGMHLNFSSGHARRGGERRAVEFLQQRHADALIVYLEETPDEEIVSWAKLAPPLVVHITGPLWHQDSRARLAGYRSALSEARVPFDERLVIEGDFQEEGGQQAATELLLRAPPGEGGVTAIFAANDQTAAGALRSLRDRGLRVPADVSLIGYDDIIFARFLQPELTTVRQPLRAMGRAAAELALAALHSAFRSSANTLPKEVQKRFEPALIQRSSVATISH